MKTRWFLLTLCALSALVDADRRTLHVGALFELSNHWYEKYINFFVTILEHVFQEVDNRTDILADYSLKLITKDTQVIKKKLQRYLFIYLNISPRKKKETLLHLRQQFRERRRSRRSTCAKSMEVRDEFFQVFLS